MSSGGVLRIYLVFVLQHRGAWPLYLLGRGSICGGLVEAHVRGRGAGGDAAADGLPAGEI